MNVMNHLSYRLGRSPAYLFEDLCDVSWDHKSAKSEKDAQPSACSVSNGVHEAGELIRRGLFKINV